MGTYLRDTYLRPARNNAERHQRGMIVANCRLLRADVEQIFRDADHWNRTHPDEDAIDPERARQRRRLRNRCRDCRTHVSTPSMCASRPAGCCLWTTGL